MTSCQRCGHEVPALPYAEGAGAHCSQSCRDGGAPLTEPYEREPTPPDPVSFEELAYLADLNPRTAAVSAMVLRHAGSPLTVGGVATPSDADVLAEHHADAMQLYEKHSRDEPRYGDRKLLSHGSARRVGERLADRLHDEQEAAV